MANEQSIASPDALTCSLAIRWPGVDKRKVVVIFEIADGRGGGIYFWK
jgi:hypothetical protein